MHPLINEYAARQSILGPYTGNYLKKELQFDEALDKYFNGKKILTWIGEGGIQEDAGIRSFQHFHDPLESWSTAGLFGGTLESSLIWAQQPVSDPANDAAWQIAREKYHAALTSVSKTKIDQDFALTFHNLGQLMHLVSDMAVPAHVRNDAHLEVKFPDWMGVTHFEKYTLSEYKSLDYDGTAHNPGLEIFSQAKYHPMAKIPITALFDINVYNGSNPEDTREGQLVGLAEYTNANFLSEGTLFEDYNYPALSETNWDDPSIDPREVWAEDGKRETVRYLVKNDGLNEPIAALSYFYINTHHPNPVGAIDIILDDVVYKSYADKLVPKAVGYSSALLDYFFRGKMEVTALPVLFYNEVYGIKVRIKNMTPTQETMTDGTFSFAIQYTPEGGAADGSDDILFPTFEVANGGLQYEDELSTFLYLPESVSIEEYKTFKYRLAFKGTLGDENNAVIGKVFSFEKIENIKFNEEWDNGLTGNNPWNHTVASDMPDNGATSNIITNGALNKNNTRYAGYATARGNNSYLDITSVTELNSRLITPDTYIQFKVDDLSINVQPPAAPGTTAAWQYIHLKFNDGRHLMFSLEGQDINWGTGLEAHYIFTPGTIVIDNIHFLFQQVGIAIPDPFYLEDISFNQQFADLGEPSTEEHHQHMENDFIRIVEENTKERIE
ncbi:MAG: hypothetical protein ABFS05_09880 [Bacteroidota bacterium]